MEDKVNSSSSVLDYFRMKCAEAVNTHRSREGNRQIILRLGEFTEDVVSSILCLIENKMEEWGERKGTIKKVFSVVVEQLQNIRINGAKEESGNQPGFIIVSKYRNDYFITTLNLAGTQNIAAIKAKIARIEGLKPEELKKLYMETLAEGSLSFKGGAGLGFITMAMKSNNHLEYLFETIDENFTIFTLQVSIIND